MTLAPGTSFAAYRIIEPLGRGGMASVYKAYEATLDRYVAVKVLPAEFLHDPTFAERFQREAKVVARLEHPNIVPIYAYGIDEEKRIPWMAMRLVPGGALSAIVRGSARRVPFGRALAILKGAADALDYAHTKGVVHRDVKPQNILLDEAERVYLADFGIAKMVESSSGLTQTGMISGTPQYMAPEQATGQTVDKRADIYALGIVAFEMFTGRVPFTADTPVAILMKHVSEAMPLPPVAEVPESLMRPVLKCTAKLADDRWPSAAAFVQALEQGLQELGSSTASAVSVAHAATGVPARTVGTARGLVTRQSEPTEAPVAQAATYVPPMARTRPPGPSTAASLPARPVSTGMSVSAVLALAAGAFLFIVAAGGAVLLYLWNRAPVPAPTPLVAESSRPPTRAPEPSTPAPSVVPATPSAEPVTPTPAPTSWPLPSERPTPRPSLQPASTPLPPSAPPVTFAPRPTSPPATAPPATQPPATQPPATQPPATQPPRPAEPQASGQVRALMGSLASSASADERWRAAETLGNLGHDARPAVGVLGAALRDRNDQVRWRAAEALGKLGPDAAEAVPALADSLDRSDMLAQESAKALGRIGPAAGPAVPALAAALTRSDVYLRREAAKALVKLGPHAQAAVPTLIEVLQDKDKTVRIEACKVLGRIGPGARAATPALQAALRDPDDLVRLQAGEALKRVAGQ